MDALFSRDTLTGLARADDADGPAAHQLDMRLGYGLAAFGDRFTATPEATLALGGERRGYGLGWRLAMRNDGATGSISASRGSDGRPTVQGAAPITRSASR